MRKIVFFAGIIIIGFFILKKIDFFNKKVIFEDLSSEVKIIQEKMVNKFFFQVKDIRLVNLKNIEKKKILNKLDFKIGDRYFFLNLQKNIENLLLISEIKSAKITIKKNGVIEIIVQEKKPFLIWLKNEKKLLIDENGDVLNFKQPAFDNLKFLKGRNANTNINAFYKILKNYPNIEKKIIYYEFIEDYRWNIIFDNKMKVMLPQKNLEKTLEMLEKVLQQSKIMNRHHKYFDMRVNNKIFLN